MNDDKLRHKTISWIEAAHSQLANAARVGFARDGRGCLVVEANRLPGTAMAQWFAAEDIVAEDPVTKQVRCLVDSYNPARQFVISVLLEGHAHGIQAKVRLDAPLIVRSNSNAIH
jgi:hypothetical protein